MMLIKPMMLAALIASPLVAMPAMAQVTDNGPARSAQLHADPSTATNPMQPQGASPNAPSNAVPGYAAKNALQNRAGGQ
jgi:hypothetical protein